MTTTLSGRVALVTGGTRGIGAAISRSLAAAGATVAAGHSANRARAEAFGAEVAIMHQGNVGNPDDCRIWKMTVDEWHQVLRVNLSGAFYMSQPTLVHMLERGSGRIVNISSVTGETGNIGQANYTASKAGLHGLTKTMAREAAFKLAREGRLGEGAIGLTVNAVTPGLIETEMAATVPANVLDGILASIPVRRAGHPDEVARVVRFLAEDASAYITGQVWGVNGGLDM